MKNKYFLVVRDHIENRVGEKMALEHAKEVLSDLTACVEKLEAAQLRRQREGQWTCCGMMFSDIRSTCPICGQPRQKAG